MGADRVAGGFGIGIVPSAYLVPDEFVITGGAVGSGTNAAWAGAAIVSARIAGTNFDNMSGKPMGDRVALFNGGHPGLHCGQIINRWLLGQYIGNLPTPPLPNLSAKNARVSSGFFRPLKNHRCRRVKPVVDNG